MADNVFWKNVKTLLKEKKLTQAGLAKKCRVSLRTLENWVYRGIIPGLEDALYIESVHNVDTLWTDYLIKRICVCKC